MDHVSQFRNLIENFKKKSIIIAIKLVKKNLYKCLKISQTLDYTFYLYTIKSMTALTTTKRIQISNSKKNHL